MTYYNQQHKLYLFLAFLALCGFFIILRDFYALAELPFLSDPGPIGGKYANDFENFWGAPQIAVKGVRQLFSLDAYNDGLRALGLPLQYTHFWPYPLHFLLLLWPLQALPFAWAYLFWIIGGMGIYGYVVSRGVAKRRSLTVLMALCAPASWSVVWGGQNGFVISALFLSVWMYLAKRPKLTGVFLGILTVKPQLGLIWCLVLLRQRRWKCIVITILSTLVLLGITTAIYSLDTWVHFWQVTVKLQHEYAFMEPGQRDFQKQVITLPTNLQLWGFTRAVAASLYIGISMGILLITGWILPRCQSMQEGALLLTSAALLIAPYALTYDMPAFTAALLWQILGEKKLSDGALRVYSVAYLSPALCMRMPIVPLVVLAVFLYIVAQIHRTSKNDGISPP